MSDRTPRRIVCLTEETTEVLYLLGEEDRIVGISGYTVRPARARKEKPKVSAFISAKTDRILELKPDLVLGFSNLQADIAADLARRGLNVHLFNQRSVQEILDMIQMLGAMIGVPDKAEALIEKLETGIERISRQAAALPRHPVVFFEEWGDPIISGILWVSELIEISGGVDCFPELARNSLAQDRIIKDPSEVVRRAPDIIIGSWCGRKFRPDAVAKRQGWDQIPAVRNGRLFEIKSADILQPGPAALTDGLKQLHTIVSGFSQSEPRR